MIDATGQRIDRPAYPVEVLREAIVNALVHRDYSIVGADVAIALFSDRLEIESPGRLPNTATVDALKTGFRYARNQTLVNVMRDYRYVDFRGMGIREKIIPGMRAHNGTEPDLVERGEAARVRRSLMAGSNAFMTQRNASAWPKSIFPIAAVSAHSAPEKSIRHGHPSTLTFGVPPRGPRRPEYETIGDPVQEIDPSQSQGRGAEQDA